jgi:hypothetical protein
MNKIVPVELLPCPCCRSAAAFQRVDDDEHNPNSGGQYIECANVRCGISTGLIFACGDDPKPRLLEIWNTRATPPAQPEDDLPGWVIIQREGKVPVRKGPFPDPKWIERTLTETYDAYPGCQCIVQYAPESTMPESGIEWLDIYRGDRKKRDTATAQPEGAWYPDAENVAKRIKSDAPLLQMSDVIRAAIDLYRERIADAGGESGWDGERLAFLANLYIVARKPARYGSFECFSHSPEPDECEEFDAKALSKLRALIDTTIQQEQGNG